MPRFLLAVILAAGSSAAQTKYASGQNVVPVFEGWEPNQDGSFTMVFGYLNRNYEQQMDIPIGPDNMMEPGPVDQGQPTHFYTRRQEFIFKMKVPHDWGSKDLVWTLTSAGKTERAYGTLAPVWQVGPSVYQENRGGPGELTYPEEPNSAPSIELVGSAQRTVAAGETLSLTVEVMDDGHPMPRVRRAPPAVARENALTAQRSGTPVTQAVVRLDPGVRLGVTWIVYRGGSGQVRFDPARVAVVNLGPVGMAAESGTIGGKATTKVTFSQPGIYGLRAYADDGVLFTPLNVMVTVVPSAQ